MRYSMFFFFLLLALVACERKQPQQNNTTMTDVQPSYTKDPHSFAEPDRAIMKHLELDLTVDFDTKTLKGFAKVVFENKQSDKLFLDTKGLKISKITSGEKELTFVLHDEIPFIGSALEIDITPDMVYVIVYYETLPSAGALGWHTPAQTAGKKQPYLLTQSQSIFARTWVPCQDSPGIRFTYSAKIQVPKGLMALMSAENPTQPSADGSYSFVMKQPIPAYLLALAVGNIAFKSVGTRTGVYTEPSQLDAAVYEFAEMEKLLSAAEKLYGPYQWDRYDLIVLPPSFPFGGMENPRITFATPTIIAGDRSLVSLVAHEMAHSWSGNLVTNATWNDFWLNEGFTVYFETRIMEEVYGKDFADMLAFISLQDLMAEMESLNFSDDTKLKLSLDGRNPDDGVSPIAYDKGYFFLRTIEDAVGRKAWDDFVKQYFSAFAFKTITTEQFLGYLHANLLDKYPDAEAKINIDKWVYGTGLPDNCPKVQSAKIDDAQAQLNAFVEQKTAPEKLQTNGWAYQQWVIFLRGLPSTLTTAQMEALDKQFKFTQSGNSEIVVEWFKHVIRRQYKPAYPQLEAFVSKVGRRKFIVPLYGEMMKQESTKSMAQRIYKSSRENYHSLAIETLDVLVGK